MKKKTFREQLIKGINYARTNWRLVVVYGFWIVTVAIWFFWSMCHALNRNDIASSTFFVIDGVITVSVVLTWFCDKARIRTAENAEASAKAEHQYLTEQLKAEKVKNAESENNLLQAAKTAATLQANLSSAHDEVVAAKKQIAQLEADKAELLCKLDEAYKNVNSMVTANRALKASNEPVEVDNTSNASNVDVDNNNTEGKTFDDFADIDAVFAILRRKLN